MTKQIVMLRPAGSTVDRRQPLLESAGHSSRGGVRKVRLGELAGGTAADCAAVCCCCPCGVVKLLVLAVYEVPRGLCRKALRRKRHRRLLQKGAPPPCNCAGGADENELEISVDLVDSKEMMELEKEMWERFYSNSGFWRSSSQKSDL